MFCFSVVFFIHETCIKRRKQWCLRLTGYHFHVQISYYSTVECLKDKTINLTFFVPRTQPRPRLLLENNPGKYSAVRRSCFLPHSTDIDYKLLHTHTHMHSLPLPRSLASVALNRQPDRRVCGQRREWLRDRMAAWWSWITSLLQ